MNVKLSIGTMWVMCLAILLPFHGYTQVDRSKAPEPGSAREIKIGEYQSFTLENGLRVFVVENHKLPRIQFSIQLLHDPILEGEKAGYISIAGELIGTGTTTRTKSQLDEEVDFIGAALSTSATSVYASSLTKHSDKLLDLMTDVLFNPSFPPEELEKLKTQTLSGISAGKDDPETIAANVKGVLLYGKDHPYGEIVTEATVKAVTLEDCKEYYNEYFRPNNAYLVMVGDVDLKRAKAIAENRFSKWTRGKIESKKYEQPHAPEKTFVALVDRPTSVQSVISVSYPLELKIGSPDVIKTRVLNQILGGNFSARLNQNLREKHGYTYGAGSSISSDNLVGQFSAGASVRNEVTDSAVFEILAELNKIVNAPVTESELRAAKASIAGSFGRSLEKPQTIAGFAVSTARYNLPPDYFSSYLKRLDAITLADVQAVAKEYIHPDQAYIEVVGNAAEIEAGLKKFGEVRYFDIHGNNYVPAVAQQLPDGITAQEVIDKHLEAIGGKQKLNKIKSVKLKYRADAMGREVTMSIYKSANKALQEISSEEAVLQKVMRRGDEYSMVIMGGELTLAENEKERIRFDSEIFPDMHMQGVKSTLLRMEDLNGRKVYVVEYNFPKGTLMYKYYDVETGLKVRLENEVDTPEGRKRFPVTIEGYREIKGVKFAERLIQELGPVSLTFDLVEVEINPKLDDAIFK